MKLYADRLESPLGTILLISDGERLCALDFRGYDHRMNGFLAARFGTYELQDAHDPGGAATAVRAYFDGDFAALDAVAVDPGGTPFQALVWTELRRIPPGAAISYRELARRVGQPTASRAVGHANGQNPVAIVIPCHRVIGADATLTGYGGGLERKRWLLTHEGVPFRDEPPRARRQLEGQLSLF